MIQFIIIYLSHHSWLAIKQIITRGARARWAHAHARTGECEVPQSTHRYTATASSIAKRDKLPMLFKCWKEKERFWFLCEHNFFFLSSFCDVRVHTRTNHILVGAHLFVDCSVLDLCVCVCVFSAGAAYRSSLLSYFSISSFDLTIL